jgi:hypothetical protein
MLFSVAVLAYTACRSLYPLRLSGAALPRSRPSSFTSSPLAIPHPSPVAILHRQRAFRMSPRLFAARSMRECHPPKSPLFRPLRRLHLCSRLPNHDIDFHDVIKCHHFYRQLPPSPLSLTKNASNVAKRGSLRSVVVSGRRSSVVALLPHTPQIFKCGGMWGIIPCPTSSFPVHPSGRYPLPYFIPHPSSLILPPPSSVRLNGLLRRMPL